MTWRLQKSLQLLCPKAIDEGDAKTKTLNSAFIFPLQIRVCCRWLWKGSIQAVCRWREDREWILGWRQPGDSCQVRRSLVSVISLVSTCFLKARRSTLPWPGPGQCGGRVQWEAVLVRGDHSVQHLGFCPGVLEHWEWGRVQIRHTWEYHEVAKWELDFEWCMLRSNKPKCIIWWFF